MLDSYASKLCTPLQAIQLVQHEVDRGIEVARHIRMEVDPGRIIDYIKVWTPDDGTPGGTPAVERPPADALDLEWGLPKLLACAKSGRAQLAVPDSDVLLVRGDIPRDRLVETIRTLERAASPCYAASVPTADGPVYVLHVLDEYNRLSGLDGLKALGVFDEWQELQCYAHERVKIFLPESLRPDRELLVAFSTLLAHETVATMLHLTRQGRRQELYYILKRGFEAEAEFDVLPLPESAFVDTGEVGVPAAATVRVVPLAPRPAPPLAELLQEHAPGAGYRLQLRPSRYRADLDLEHEKLRLRRAELDQRLAHLESIHQQRPVLLRFGPGQIRALAEVIYSYPAESLSESQADIRYAFQANRQAPEGYHYLLVGPGAVRHQMDPLLLHDNEPPMRFWLDPSWARYYPDDGNVCYVFVPEHTALFPSLHTWHTEEMDRHLREVLSGRWLRESGAQAFPETPYYVFDWTPDGDSLELSVLAEEDFVPPRTRLQWISEHLTVAGKVSIDKQVSEAAVAIAWERIALDALALAQKARAALDAESQATRALLAQDMNLMVQAVKRDTELVIKQISSVALHIDRLDLKRRLLLDVKDIKTASLNRFDKLVESVAKGAKAFSDRVGAVESQITESLRQAEATAVDERERVEKLLRQLEGERRRLQAELDEWTRGGR